MRRAWSSARSCADYRHRLRGLRVFGLQFGLPAVYNPDEVAIMARALSFAKGTLNPHNFLYPTLYFYVLFGWVGSYLGAVWLAGGVSTVAELQELYFTNPTGIYTAGRLLGVVCGTAAVIAVYHLGQRLFDRRVGLAAAVFLAVAPLAVRDSHYVKHDIPATLAVILALIAIVRIWPRTPEAGRLRNDVIVAAAACGVAFSTHYYCIFLALPLLGDRPALAGRWLARGVPARRDGRHHLGSRVLRAVAFPAGRADRRVAGHHREPPDRRRSRGRERCLCTGTPLCRDALDRLDGPRRDRARGCRGDVDVDRRRRREPSCSPSSHSASSPSSSTPRRQLAT